jgi:hypothetical protein
MDLAGGVLNRLGIDTTSHTAVCCGLSITDFNRVYTLDEMVDHIYGRQPIELRRDRPNMFIRELSLYVAFYKSQLVKNELRVFTLSDRYFSDFTNGLLSGIEHYRRMPSRLKDDEKDAFLRSLTVLEGQVLTLAEGQDIARSDRRGSSSEATSTLSVGDGT